MTNDGFQIFGAPWWVQSVDHARPRQSGSSKGHEKTVALIVFSRKRNRRGRKIGAAQSLRPPWLGAGAPSLLYESLWA
jgi:hypothetical protein